MDPGSIISAVHLCFQHELGVVLVKSCQHFRAAEAEVKELGIRLEGSWTRIKHQLQFIERIAHTLDDEHRRVQDEILGLLAMKLSLAQAGIDKVAKQSDNKKPSYLAFAKIRRGKYVTQRNALKAVITDLEQWQRRFDPSWFLIMRIANPVIDQQLAAQKAEQEQSDISSQGSPSMPRLSSPRREGRQSPIALATNLREALRAEPRQQASIFLPRIEAAGIDIPFSTVKAVQRGEQWFIIERYTRHAGRSLSEQTNDIRTLARKLACVDPWTFGLLNCKGVIKIGGGQSEPIRAFDFVFRAPDSMEVLQSLRQDLLSGEINHSVSRRVAIAKELAKSVSYVHNLNFVHKHVCPETILLFQDLKERLSTFLVGFDNFRASDGGTAFAGDTIWERNLYRHPTRQGEYPEEAYKMQHDVYSLGVCLLEIGIWESFVSYSSDSKRQPRHGEAYQNFTKWLESTDFITSLQQSHSARFRNEIAFKLKDYFVHLAKTRLPIAMGDMYSAVVVTCLTCLDKDNEDFGDDEQMLDEQGILVAVRFIETILLKLNEINV